MMKRTLLPSALLLALLGGACSDAVTSSPDITAAGDALRSSGGDSESMLLASTYSGAQQPGWKTVATLPDSAWVVIDVIGQVYHSRNPDCDVLPPAWQPVNYPWDRLYAGPMFGASQVAVRPLPGGGSYRLWPVNGDTETATHARVLVYSRQPGMKVEVGRVSVMSLCGNPTAGEWSPMYKLAGGQQVTVTKIGSPLVFDAPDVVAPNQKATFAVEPHGSLRLLNPPGVNGKPGRLTWWYAPGDTLPEAVHAATGYMYVIPGCLNEKVCEHAPEKSGRLVVNGYVEGTSVFRKSHVIRVDSARLELSCPDSVTRGQSMTCSVEATGGTLSDIRWRFTPTTGPGVADSSGSASWSGIMAIGGRIEVTAKLNDEPHTDTATVLVTARDWEGRVGPYPSALPQDIVAPEKLDAPIPVTENSRGYDEWTPEALGEYEFDIDWFGKFALIPSGPNKGYWYFPEPPQWTEPVVHLTDWLEPGHPFYEAQTGRRQGERPPPREYSGWCTSEDMDTLRREVQEHEGSLAGPPLSHHEFNVDYTAQNDPGPALESVVFFTPEGPFQKTVREELGRAYVDAMLAANYAAVHAESNLFKITCKVHYP